MLGGTQKNQKERKLDKKKSHNQVGPEYPGEGAMHNILIAGSTDIQDLLMKKIYASSPQDRFKDLIKQKFLGLHLQAAAVKEMIKQNFLS